MTHDFGGKPWQGRPRGGFWLAKEFWAWPEIEAAGLPAVGHFIRYAIWARSFDRNRIVSRVARGHLADRLVEVGLWQRDGRDFVTRTMEELRSGRGRPGLTMRLSRLMDGYAHTTTPTAAGLWAIAASWSLNTDSPGFVPTEIALKFAKAKVAAKLWEANLWLLSEHGFRMSKGDHPIETLWALARDDERRPIAPPLRAAVYERDGHACVECGCADDLSLDHIVPWSWGGPDTEDNLRTLCRPCNSRKGDRLE